MDANREHLFYTIKISLDEDINTDTIGGRVKFLRTQQDLTCKKLSQITGISESVISRIEKENYTPYISTYRRLAEGLNADMTYLLDLDKLPEKTTGETIKKYRLKKGLSLRDLADLCNLHQTTIKDYEDGKLRNEDTYNYIMKILKD